MFVLTQHKASIIKKYRETGSSWRRIAEKAALEFPELDIESGNQLDGRELCNAAALVLGENQNEDPWNC